MGIVTPEQVGGGGGRGDSFHVPQHALAVVNDVDALSPFTVYRGLWWSVLICPLECYSWLEFSGFLY